MTVKVIIRCHHDRQEKNSENAPQRALVCARRSPRLWPSLARDADGYAPEEWKDRPVIAILNTWSDAQPCHMHFKSRVDDVKRGILMAAASRWNCRRCRCPESLLKPTTMLYRNLLAMDARSCCAATGRRRGADGRLRQDHAGAAARRTSMNLPAIISRPDRCCAATGRARPWARAGCWKYWDERRAGKISDKDWVDVEAASRAATAPA